MDACTFLGLTVRPQVLKTHVVTLPFFSRRSQAGPDRVMPQLPLAALLQELARARGTVLVQLPVLQLLLLAPQARALLALALPRPAPPRRPPWTCLHLACAPGTL